MTALGFGIPGIGQSSSAVFAAAPPLPSSPSGPSSRRAVPSRAVRRIYVLVASFSVADGAVRNVGPSWPSAAFACSAARAARHPGHPNQVGYIFPTTSTSH